MIRELLLLTQSIACGFLMGCNDCGLGLPVDDADDRPMLLTFGLYVTPDPEKNPIDPPERFTGYHTALDFEVFDDEQEEDVQVYAICDGKVTYSSYAEGYGGVVIQTCMIRDPDADDGTLIDVTVLYGHLDLHTSAPYDANVRKGDRIGTLADAHSHGSGDTRKHLHLGIHRGSERALLGYVQTEQELDSYIDPARVLPL